MIHFFNKIGENFFKISVFYYNLNYIVIGYKHRLKIQFKGMTLRSEQATFLLEELRGIVERVTFHSETTGWSVLRVRSFDEHNKLVTVTVHQTRVFAGATMHFKGAWTQHPKYGRQFKAKEAVEKKPASAGALEKYLGSGLIKGVGPKTARKIVTHFGANTLQVFEHDMQRLLEVPGIAKKKLRMIQIAWEEHRAVRDVMIFLQSHEISTLFAVRIFKQYGDKAISMVQENPYRLAKDFYGIGFFSADKVALSLGFAKDSPLRVMAAISHILSASREQGHCYLTKEQIIEQVNQLLQNDLSNSISYFLHSMAEEKQLHIRVVAGGDGKEQACYYNNVLYYDEKYVGERLRSIKGSLAVEPGTIKKWLTKYESGRKIQLSPEQANAVCHIVGQRCSVLTGGPGCGKTTTTKVLVHLLQSLGNSVMLAAPTGRAAQRMSEVIGMEAKTIHRLLEYQVGGFFRCEENPLETDFLIIDECSMLDINLTASLLRAVGTKTALLLIGDQDQLPSVGAGNVLHDIIASKAIPCFHLSAIFRQAEESAIVRYAHKINCGEMVYLESPFKRPSIWRESDCFFIDAEEATKEQLRLIHRVKKHFSDIDAREIRAGHDPYGKEETVEPYTNDLFSLPEKFKHVEVQTLRTAESSSDQLMAVLKKVHPWSSLYWGLTARDVVCQLYASWIPKYFPGKEIQILSPMIRGSLGTASLNTVIQDTVNPRHEEKPELTIGEKLFRQGDRIIHRKNNYDLGVFNGDIGIISKIDNQNLAAVVSFFPDGREVEYQREVLSELDLAYAITVHKSQGSEFDVVILPVVTQHFKMLFRNLLYTGLTRAKKLAVLVGTRQALALTISNQETANRQTQLAALLQQ